MESFLGEIRNGKGHPSASKDRWQHWTELIPAGENWLQASQEHLLTSLMEKKEQKTKNKTNTHIVIQ